ncbi:MAG: hypothetical protein M3Y49_00150 [Actinomycetota bacterium]|nr:hypothetical protein [Actinomycetota bacterium]
MNVQDQARDIVKAYAASIDVAPVETIYARAERNGLRDETPALPKRRHRRAWRAAVGVAVALVVAIPTATGLGLISYSISDPLAGLNPDAKSGPPSSHLVQVPAGSQKVTGGYVTLTVLPGTVDDRSCYSLVEHDTKGVAFESVAACGGGDRATYVGNTLGVGVAYSDDAGVALLVVAPATGPDRTLRLHDRYAITSQLPPGPVTITTYDAHAKVIAVHHDQVIDPSQIPTRRS